MRTSAPGIDARCGATVRQASGMLSLALAIAAGASCGGAATSIASAKGTRIRSESIPPQSPPSAPKPYIERSGTDRQLPVSPARQRAHSPQEIWNGTTTTSPGAKALTSDPTAATSPTHSWPSLIGPGIGASPSTIGPSRSHVATARGLTRASAGPCRSGSGTSAHSRRCGSIIISCRIPRRTISPMCRPGRSVR